jgi:uncharacterized FAD-dependent dehydrogenase
MIKQIELTVLPHEAFDPDVLKIISAKKLGLNPSDNIFLVQRRRSIDARSKYPHYKILADVFVNDKPSEFFPKVIYKPVKQDKKVIIVGFGPGGMFAALRLIEIGIKPVIIERGKDVQSRRRDLKSIQQFGIVHPDSNYCFGEGGAGTYSDGKLYTRSTKRGDVKKILNLFVQHGANEDILIDAHPHIGSNKLPKIVKNIRETILENGGEIHFSSRVTDFILNGRKIIGAVVNDEKEFTGEGLILAAGHSARDIFYLLHKKNIKLEAKPFAMGVRIEHPQSIIDEIQYHSPVRSKYLPAASYNLNCQVGDNGIFSFCMCPGGIIVPASTAQDELVLNGMSVSRRDSLYANSGLVVTVNEKNMNKYKEFGPFAGLEFQIGVEKIAFEAGGGNQKAPAQRITDFVKKKISSSLPKSSYIPGINSAPLHSILPENISMSLSKAILVFDKKMKGFFTEEAQILAAETRTSSPVRIPRNKGSLMHIEIKGLFPCGEGAGYAGGIISSAIDGENCAEAVARYVANL